MHRLFAFAIILSAISASAQSTPDQLLAEWQSRHALLKFFPEGNQIMIATCLQGLAEDGFVGEAAFRQCADKWGTRGALRR